MTAPLPKPDRDLAERLRTHLASVHPQPCHMCSDGQPIMLACSIAAVLPALLDAADERDAYEKESSYFQDLYHTKDAELASCETENAALRAEVERLERACLAWQDSQTQLRASLAARDADAKGWRQAVDRLEMMLAEHGAELARLRELEAAVLEQYACSNINDHDCTEAEYDRWSAARSAYLRAIAAARASRKEG